jgi:CRP-like cAMP-binding protein
MSWLEDGTIVILGVWGPGDLVGEALTQLEPYQIECLTAVKATLLSNDLWQYNLDTTAALLHHIKQAEEFLLIRSHRRIDAMLLRLLAWLAKKFGKEAEAGQLIDLRLTHQDIAEMLGTTRVTITRVLSQLEQQGMIRRLPLHRIVLKEEELWHYEI